jgi:hypothetical protein
VVLTISENVMLQPKIAVANLYLSRRFLYSFIEKIRMRGCKMQPYLRLRCCCRELKTLYIVAAIAIADHNLELLLYLPKFKAEKTFRP